MNLVRSTRLYGTLQEVNTHRQDGRDNFHAPTGLLLVGRFQWGCLLREKSENRRFSSKREQPECEGKAVQATIYLSANMQVEQKRSKSKREGKGSEGQYNEI